MLLKGILPGSLKEVTFKVLCCADEIFYCVQEALETTELVETILKENSKTKPLLPQQLIRHREVQLPSGE